MKKLLNTAFIYALAAMAGGVFYREFTKFNGFSGRTALGLVHTHLFLLGTVFFLLAALFSKELDWARERNFRLFYGLYNTGLCVTAVMLAVRGAAQVRAVRWCGCGYARAVFRGSAAEGRKAVFCRYFRNHGS